MLGRLAWTVESHLRLENRETWGTHGFFCDHEFVIRRT
jgi:hypothetical protein